jgi:hypothetical protein
MNIIIILDKYVKYESYDAKISQPNEAYHGRKNMRSQSRYDLSTFDCTLGYFGHTSKQRRASTTPSGGKPDNKAHQQNAGSG